MASSVHWELNLNTRRLTAPDGGVSVLSKGEFSPSRLHNDEVYSRAIDIQIMRLRRKIEPDPSKPRYIRTERGNGYVFSVNVETVY
jgi:two-component system, OmpR family, response regulator